MTTASAGAVNEGRQNVERTQGGNPSATSMHGLPARTVIAAIPARSTAEAPNHVLSVILPVQVRSQVAMPNQSTVSQGSQTAVGGGSQPQASVGGVASIPSIVAQVTAQVANALSANQQGQVSSSAQNTVDQGSRSVTTNGVDNVDSLVSASTQLQNELSDSNNGHTSLNAQSLVAGAGAFTFFLMYRTFSLMENVLNCSPFLFVLISLIRYFSFKHI